MRIARMLALSVLAPYAPRREGVCMRLWKLSAGFGPNFLETGWLAPRPSVSNAARRSHASIIYKGMFASNHELLLMYSTLSIHLPVQQQHAASQCTYMSACGSP